MKRAVLESYCWMYADFNIPEEYSGPCSGKDNEDDEGNTRSGNIYNSYYQWVPIYLVILAILFYLPRFIWISMEGGLMKFFAKGTTTRSIEDSQEKVDKLVEVIFHLSLSLLYIHVSLSIYRAYTITIFLFCSFSKITFTTSTMFTILDSFSANF